MNDTIGIDISKDWLDAFRLSDRAQRAFDNTQAGFRALRRWLAMTSASTRRASKGSVRSAMTSASGEYLAIPHGGAHLVRIAGCARVGRGCSTGGPARVS